METNYYNKAYKFDLEGKRDLALENYLLSIENNEEIIDSYLNAIGILLEFLIEFSTVEYSLSKVTDDEEYLLKKLIRECKTKDDNNMDVRFLEYYYNWYYRKNHFNYDKLNSFLERDINNPFGSVILGICSPKDMNDFFRKKVNEFILNCKVSPTTKNIYFKSLV